MYTYSIVAVIYSFLYQLLQIGSPTILADPAVEKTICLTTHPHGVYIPVGAMWGAHDIRKMADMGTLKVIPTHVQCICMYICECNLDKYQHWIW